MGGAGRGGWVVGREMGGGEVTQFERHRLAPKFGQLVLEL